MTLESKIGFDSLRAYLVDKCESPMGAREVGEMSFLTDYRAVVERLERTSEMKRMLESGEDRPEVSFNELEKWLPSLKSEGAYAPSENFLQLRRSLVSFDNVRNYYRRTEGKGEGAPFIYPALAGLFGELMEFPDLLREIDRVIDKTGYVKDSASPELAEVRQKLSSLQGSVARTIQRVFSRAVGEGIADKDAGPTIRDGRMVIPVSAGNKRRLSGIVHDESATGKTVFIEPAETVELSNRIRELQLEEQRIIVRILMDLSDRVRPYIADILSCNALLGKLDFIMAKARFAIETGGELPNISRTPEIDWYGAVHPVLLLNLRSQGRNVVPLNLRLDGRKRFLIISGPNAGGKSVALKTVAIVQYMCQCGMLPTLHSNSHIGIFNRILMDIGDEQSIENDLSTYSSHLRNMRYFLLHADKRSLVLIDEIGSGTEPTIGASLAMAILEELAKSRCFGIVTTHYHSLKRFAEEHDTFVNGAMLYDRQHLQPTFQLSIGTAGSSFALEIASKIGLPRPVIEAAKKTVGEDYVESDRFLMEIQRDRKYWQNKRASIREREIRLESLEQKYEKMVAELNQRKKEIIKEAQQEARELLSATNRKIENTISEIRQAEAEKERTKQVRRELEDYKASVEAADENVALIKTRTPRKKQKQPANQPAKNPRTSVQTPVPVAELAPGSYVRMKGSSTTGQIISITGKEAEVAFGQLRTKVKIDRLSPAQAPSRSLTSGYNLLNAAANDAGRERQLNFRNELDIRGMRADEALDRVIHYIDDAIQFGAGRVRILHGTGGGILRQLVRQQLQATRGVTSFEDEDVRFGGAGITVVNL